MIKLAEIFGGLYPPNSLLSGYVLPHPHFIYFDSLHFPVTAFHCLKFPSSSFHSLPLPSFSFHVLSSPSFPFHQGEPGSPGSPRHPLQGSRTAGAPPRCRSVRLPRPSTAAAGCGGFACPWPPAWRQNALVRGGTAAPRQHRGRGDAAPVECGHLARPSPPHADQ